MAITGCNFDDEDIEVCLVPEPSAEEVTFGSFNVSFAVDGDSAENFERWVGFMELSRERQNRLIAYWRTQQGNPAAKESADYKLAERVIQIRNIAAIIQKNRPDVLLLNEFNNDGTAENMAAIKGFQQNYLAHSQSLNSVDGGDMLKPIFYPFTVNYPTNTGLIPDADEIANSDLDNNGPDTTSAGDAYGFGFYHGHYAFALFSKYKVDIANTRTFQTFKWKDLPGEVNPTITLCDNPNKPIPAGMMCGDNWYSDAEWDGMRLSSKNHVDAPIIIPTTHGDRVIHVLLSHPTPPIDGTAKYNTMRNGAENKFWARYLDGVSFTDDKGHTSAFTGQDFVVMGDLNADAQRSPANTNGFTELTDHVRINQAVSQIGGEFLPTSLGGAVESNPKKHPYPETRTSTFGSRADYALPSASLTLGSTGVYWVADGTKGRLLFNDPRIGKRGTDKEVSSDHRYVWTTVKLNAK